MKVLHLLSSSSYSGAENVACQIIKMFEGEVEMAYCAPYGEIEKTLKDKNIKYIPIKKLSIKEVLKVVNEYKPDVLHCHDLKATIIGSFIKNVTKVSHIHGNKSNMNRISLKSIIYYLCAKKHNRILWVSTSCFEDYKFKQKLKDKSTILPNIISIDNLNESKNKDTNTYDYNIVYLGRLVYEKNPTRLIEIATILKQKLPEFKMAIIGDGEYKQELLNLIAQNQLENNVFMLGFNPNPHKIVADADVMLLTSVMEGTPMCAIEAMSLGVPVVSTKTDGMVELIKTGENGFLYDTNDQAVQYLLAIINKEHKDINKTTLDFAIKYNDLESYKQKLRNCYNLK